VSTRAVLIESFDDVPHLATRPLPPLGEDGVLVRIHAASVNAFDWKIAEGRLQNRFEYVFPVTIGRDYAGVVEEVGSAVERVSAGDAVVGYTTGQRLEQGSYAERIVVSEDDCFVPKPDGLSFVEAACLPLCGMVAYRCVDAVDPKPGETHFVLGAPGAAGSYAVQLLAARGAHVVASGLPEDVEYLRDLGAAEVVGYRKGVEYAGPADGLIDTVQYKDAFTELATRLLRPGGRAASLHRAADPELLEPIGVTGTNVHSGPDRDLLARIVADADSGSLRVPVRRVFPFEEAPQALELLRDEHARGKFALSLVNSE
jgi:NADPH:quinone reductase-like Zn-dependent oxidoreductase